MIAGRSGFEFYEACGELSNEEIQMQYGALMDGAQRAFRLDVSYLVDMARRANAIAAKREQWEERKVKRQAEKEAAAHRLLEDTYPGYAAG